MSNVVVDIQPSGIGKFFDIVSEMKDAISIGVGEPDFDTPWHIREEGIYALEKGRTFYTSNAGLKELKISPDDIDYIFTSLMYADCQNSVHMKYLIKV